LASQEVIDTSRGSLSSVWMRFHKSLIVSCQVPKGSPLDRTDFLAAMAQTVEEAGASAIRAEGIKNVEAIAQVVKIPVIGLVKESSDASPVYITPRVQHVVDLANAGASIVAVDATLRRRPKGETIDEFYQSVRGVTHIPLLGDIDSVQAGIHAEHLGFDAIATTLNGYTDEPGPDLPNIDLITKLRKSVKAPIIAEGGFSTINQVRQAFEQNAWSVCVGTAITNPYLITQKFVEEAVMPFSHFRTN
jgi:N-acylglucosamine-6-phosphate 2-epimerase